MSEFTSNTLKTAIENSYGGKTVKMPDGKNKDGEDKNLDGKGSLLNSISVLSYKHPTSGDNGYKLNPSSYYTNNKANKLKNPTGTNIVKEFTEGNGKHFAYYKPEDFLFLSNYGKIPNNYLLTIRRYPSPCFDNIFDKNVVSMPDSTRLLSYMDGEDNKLEDIMSFGVGFNWKEFESEIQTIDRNKTIFGGNNSYINKVSRTLDTSGRSQQESLQGAEATNFDPYQEHQNNYTWGPIDVIDKIMTRDRGLTFDHPITIKCKYAVRSYNGTSPKVVFLDIIGNILNLVSNKAPFWGGSVRFTGGGGYGVANNDGVNKLRNGDVAGFLQGLSQSIGNKLKGVAENPLEGLKNIAGNLASSLMGGALDKLGRPEMHSIHSLLEGTPTGEWHLTVGNPFNPTMVIGNLILEDAKIGVEGPLNVDDVPSFVTVELSLKHAMIRDKFAIQSMFNSGKGRYYSSRIDFLSKKYYRNRSASSTNNPARTASQTIDSEIDAADRVNLDDYKESIKKLF